MRKFSRLIWSVLLIGVVIFGFASCKAPEGEEPGETPSAVDEDVIYSEYVNSRIILGEGVFEEDVDPVRSAYYRVMGKEISVMTDKSQISDHEIIIGRTDRPLSERAYRHLSLFYEEEDFVGYVIVSDGRSVAIAFDERTFGENVAFDEGVECFAEEFMKGKSLKLSDGIIYRDAFDPIKKQKERDEEKVDKIWELKLSQLSAKLGDEAAASAIVDELKNIRFIYNNDHAIVKWLANLYDPETGGFYYSNSARNSEGYLPDLESTSGAIGIVESILLEYEGDLVDYFGEEISEKFVSFVKEKQNENGYFYHPQWKRSLIDENQERRTRDLLNALNILDYFGASPIYDTPNGVKGEGAVAAAAKLALPLKERGVAPASVILSAANDEIYIPPHLRTKEAFENYLSGLQIKDNAAEAFEKLSSELALYIIIDEMLEERKENYRLCDILKNFLKNNQNSSTGLWSKSADVTYEDAKTLINAIKLYDGLKTSIPLYNAILQTMVRILEFNFEVDDISCIATAWSALAVLVNNLKVYGNEGIRFEIENYLNGLYRSSPGLLETTKEHLLKFSRYDGAFSSAPEGNAAEMMGMPVAVPLMEEGDVRATLLATNSIWLSVFRVFDIGNVPIFTTSDRMMFQKTLLDMGVIIKNEVRKTPPIDFENTDIGESSDVRVEMASTYGTKAEVVFEDEERGNALRLYSPPDRKASTSDKFYFDMMTSVRKAGCFEFELDMCINDVSSYTNGENFAYLMFANDVYAIALNRKGNTIRFFEETSARAENSYSQDLGIRVEVGEWFNIRVEYYPGTAETVRIKIYFNGECVAVTDNYYDYYAAKYEGTGAPKQDSIGFAVYGLWGQEMDVLVDNILVEKTYKSYEAETSQRLNKNVDTKDKPQTLYDFEKENVGSVPSEFEVGGKEGSVSVTADADQNKLLSVSEGAGEIKLPLEQIGSGVNSGLIELDLIVSSSSAVGATYQISFNEYLYKERTFGALQLIVFEEGGSKYACFADVVSGKTGNVYSKIKLSTDVRYRLSFRIFFEENTMVASVDGEIICVSANVLAGCRKFYMGETAIEALTPSLKSTLLIDNLVCARVKGDYEEVTSPDIPREDHSFDGTDNMELTGVSPADGVLSFAGEGAEKEVRIPVNTRVNVPTMAFVGVDIKTLEASEGSLKISFIDSSEKIIAAFDLVLGGADVELYEHTANGRYKAPIHVIKKSEFTLSFEYSSDEESFNVLVDGEYEAASSLTYTFGEKASEPAYLSISTVGSAGFVIDNLYAERSYGIFKPQRVSLENTDSADEINTYETSSFASLPTSISTQFGSSSSYFKIREGSPSGNVSKVLEFYTAHSSSDYAFFKRSSTSSDANAAFFETDIMLVLTSENWISAELCLQSKVSGTPSQYTFNVVANSKGEALEVKGAGGKDFVKTLDVKEGEWFKLRIEYRDTPDDFNYDGYRDCIFRAYVNGVLVGEGKTHNYPTAVQSYDTVHQLRFAAYGSSEGKIYFDNTTLGQCKMEYAKPIPPDTDTLTYTPGVITNKTKFTFGNKASTAKIIEMANAEDAANKVLSFYSSKGSSDNMAISPTLTSETANGITLETDIMISPRSGETVLYIEPQASNGKAAFRLTVKASLGGDVTISSADIPETVIGKSGEWMHIRIDYMNPRVDYDGDRRLDILYKIYVNGSDEAAAVGHKPYISGTLYDPMELEEYNLSVSAESEADIYLDNTRFWQTELVADEAPEFDYSEKEYYGNTGSDESGWS